MNIKIIGVRFLKIIAVFLLLNNIVGLFKTLRNEEIYNENNTLFKNDIILNEEQLLDSLSDNIMSDKMFAIRANEAINNGIAHFWSDEGISKYNLRIPFSENYILFIASYLKPSAFEKYEYCDYQKAIERGVGLCSQHSIILSEILKTNNIESKILNLSGHVVLTANIDKKNDIWWVFDPDYGVVIKHEIEQIEKKPEKIGQYYSEKGYNYDQIKQLISIYGPDGNSIKNDIIEYSGKKKYYFEKISYIAIWVFPLLLFLFLFKNK